MTEPEETPEGLLGKVADELVPTLAPLVDAQMQKWVALAVNKMAELIPFVPMEAQGLMVAAMNGLREKSGLVGQVSGQEFGAIVHHLAMGKEDAARLVWLGGGASFDERMKARDDASDATRARDARSAERWAEVKTVGETVAKAVITAGIPVVLAL